MIQNNRGHVVGISSMAGVMGLPNLVPYCGSKFAVRGLMEAISEELRHDARKIDVKFTTICPFVVETGLCKKPRTRFPFLLNFVPVKKAATAIISAQRRNYSIASIPHYLLYCINLSRLLPLKAAQYINDFMDSGVDSDWYQFNSKRYTETRMRHHSSCVQFPHKIRGKQVLGNTVLSSQQPLIKEYRNEGKPFYMFSNFTSFWCFL